MPARMVDGDAIASSTKLQSIPEKYRFDYAYWLTFAQANGTFEANAQIIWAKYYSYQYPSRKLKHISEIMEAFSRAGLLILWEQDGKQWGFFSGNEKPGRLPNKKHLSRYNNLPPSYPGLVQDESRISPENVRTSPQGFGLGLGLGRNEEDRSEHARLLASSFLSQEQIVQQEREMNAKRFAERLAVVWHAVHGDSAIMRMLKFEESKKDFEFLVENHDQNMLEDAFRLWAKEKGNPRDAYPLSKFLKDAAEYSQRVKPLEALEAKEKQEATVQEASIERQTQEIVAKRDRKPLVPVSEVSADDIFGEEK